MVSENMEDLLHLVLAESPIPQWQRIHIFAAWTAFVNLTSFARHVLWKLIVITLYIESRYILLHWQLPAISSWFSNSFIHSSDGMGLILKRWHFAMLASPSSSTTPMNLALCLSKVLLTLWYLIQRGFIELASTSVAVASLLETTLPDVSNCFVIVGFLQLLKIRKLSSHSPSLKYSSSWRCKAKSPSTTTTTQYCVLPTHMNSKKWR